MASSSTLKRSNSNSRKSLFCNNSRKFTKFDGIVAETSLEETSLQRQMETLSVSERLVRTVSRKFKKNSKKKNDHGDYSIQDRINGRPSSSTCLNLYIKGGGCSRVTSCEEFDRNGKRRSGEDCMPLRGVLGVEKHYSKGKGVEQCSSSSTIGISLPDDVLEMILIRLPLTSLMAARLVCKKWNFLIITPQFMQLRSEGSHRSPWLFLFGITKKDGCHAGEVHVLDVTGDNWHRISIEKLKGRFFFSVASIGLDLYIIGGCSTSANSNSFKTHKGVLVFSPLTRSCREVSPMKAARQGPVLGVFEVSSHCSIFHTQSNRQDQDRLRLKTRVGEVSDVYEDPHRFSLRRQLRDAFNESNNSTEPKKKPSKFVARGRSNQPKFALIAVGGRGSWDEPLDSGEIYDPITNKWVEIASLPGDFGAVGSGAVCFGMFYVYSEADKLARYDLERGFWVTIQTSQPPPRLREYYPKLVSCRNRLFMVCVCWCERDGQVNRREKAVRKIWEMDTVTHTWAEVSRHPDAPMDWNAAFVANKDRIYGVEMFRIFGQVLDFVTACHVSDTKMEWCRISKKHPGHEAVASSCMKSMVVLHL